MYLKGNEKFAIIGQIFSGIWEGGLGRAQYEPIAYILKKEWATFEVLKTEGGYALVVSSGNGAHTVVVKSDSEGNLSLVLP